MKTRRATLAWVVGVAGIVGIGVLDYLTGFEIRVFPLYYVPLAVLAWHSGWTGMVVAAVLCGVSWVLSNRLAGLQFAMPSTWWINTGLTTGSFLTVGLLIASLRRSLTQEREIGRTDPLTGMLNRQGFYEEARRLMALCRRTGRPATVAYLDLDDFKRVNDREGHEAGDEVLRRVADVLSTTLRPSDVAGRLGGDEFVVFLPEVPETEARHALERIRSAIANALAPCSTPVTASVGGACFADVPADVEDLIRRADARMYAAKSKGRNRIDLELVTASDSAARDADR